ncbi:MAG TPA: hypothetical protein VI485_13715 [Vicinamibacterales bacterium]|nr:hypothetical protein [Vicinamibacterales bacterium]
MTRRSRTIGSLLSALLIGCGCGTSSGAPGTPATTTTIAAASPSSSAVTPAPAPASGAAANVAASAPDTSAATSAVSPAVTSTPAPVASAAPPVVATAAAESPEALRKKVQIAWALKQDEIKSDPNGAWAVQAKASSAYHDAKGTSPYSPSQATGLPNIEGYGNSALAWVPKTPDAGIEWLELQYSKPVHATMVRVRESYGSGAVMKVELFDEQGAPHTVWTGADLTKELDYLVVEFPKTAFKSGRVKLTLATNVVSGSNQIDAVQLVGTDQ